MCRYTSNNDDVGTLPIQFFGPFRNISQPFDISVVLVAKTCHTSLQADIPNDQVSRFSFQFSLLSHAHHLRAFYEFFPRFRNCKKRSKQRFVRIQRVRNLICNHARFLHVRQQVDISRFQIEILGISFLPAKVISR